MRHLRAVELVQGAADPGADDGRTVTVRVVSWNTDYRVSDDGRRFYRERFVPGGLNMRPGAELVATLEHDPRLLQPGTQTAGSGSGRPVGRIAQTYVRSDGLYADVRVFDSLDGDAFLDELNRAGRRLYVSSEFDDTPVPADAELVERIDAQLTGLAFTRTPQHADAQVVAVRSEITNTNTDPAPEDPDMDNDTPVDDTPVDDTPDTPDTPAPAAAHARSAPAPRQTPRPGVAAGTPVADRHFRSFGDFAQRVARGELGELGSELRERYTRALATATTADAAGLLPPQWMTDVIDIYRTMTPTVQAFAQRSLPDTGLVVNQPVVTQRPIVNKQASQLDEVASQKATIGTATWNVATYGGGNNVSLQTILRTEPSYLDELYRLWVREMALDINLDVATALYAAANDTNTTALEYVDAAGFDELIVDASAVFMDTLHRPAEVVLISVDLWKALAKAKDSAGEIPLYPSLNPMNRSGSINAVDRSGNIIGVTWYVEPALGGVGDGISGVIGVRDAWMTATSPMGTLAADVPSNLSQDHAVYQFAAYGATDTAGLYQIADAA